MRPGEQLKSIRTRLRITTREVEEHSRRIGELEGSEEFFVSNSWLTQIENKDSVPSIHKLYSLASIYRINYMELLRMFGLDLNRIAKHQLESGLDQTTLASLDVYEANRAVTFPLRFDANFSVDRTGLVSRMVEVWGEVPIALVQHLDVRASQYGYIGLKDYTLYPLVRPGSFVQIDQRANIVQPYAWRSEYDRPIYFIELRDGYACGWCELDGNELSLLQHPLSPCKIRRYKYGTEAEVIGRVTAVAMRIVDSPARENGESARLPKRL